MSSAPFRPAAEAGHARPAHAKRKDRRGMAGLARPGAGPPGTVQETGSYLFELHDSRRRDDADLLIDDVHWKRCDAGARYGALALVAGISCRHGRSRAAAARSCAAALRGHHRSRPAQAHAR